MTYTAATTSLQQKLESVSYGFFCADLFFQDLHHLSKIIVQQHTLTCESRIGKGYLNHKDRKVTFSNTCIYCGKEGKEDAILCQLQLIELKLTWGKLFPPLCVNCLKSGKKVLKMRRKDALNIWK